MISATFQISSFTSLAWRRCPFTVSEMAPVFSGPVALGAALLLHFGLQVAARHVQAHGVAVHMGLGVGGLDVAPAAADGHHELDLVVQVLRERRVVEGAGLALGHDDDVVGGLQEEERRLATGEAHLLGVLGVVAADAIDAAHREGPAAHDGHENGGGRGDDEAHGRWGRVGVGRG